MTTTIRIAADRANDDTITVLPAEVARGVYIQNPPSAAALKLLVLLIGKAGGALAEDRWHSLRLSDLRAVEGMKNHDRASLRPLFVELVVSGMRWYGAQADDVGGIVDRIKADYSAGDSGNAVVTWRFGSLFREMAEQSTVWAILDRQTVFAMTSKYSVLLFQHIASLVNLDHITSKTYTVAELRRVLGVPEGKLSLFGHLNNRAIQYAIAEINALSRFTLTATVQKQGRAVVGVTISWAPKPDPTEIKRELDRPKVGRKARINGTAEAAALSFPSSGGIGYSEPWGTIARENSKKDSSKIAEAFRDMCRANNVPLDHPNIAKRFTGFCKTQFPE